MLKLLWLAYNFFACFIKFPHYFFRPRDVYHTCYTLSGLSVVQHGTSIGNAFVVGTPRNELNTIHPLHNIAPHFVYNAMDYWRKCNLG